MTPERLREIAAQVKALAGEIAPARDFLPAGGVQVDGELQQIANELRGTAGRISGYLLQRYGRP